jgi:L,D-peptidoglycan transpeptidase YkuD (ErfK/YbiS/YcfS/YnhG family)
MAALDLQLLIGAAVDGAAAVRVLSSPAGETTGSMTLPFGDAALAAKLAELQAALLAPSPGEHGGPAQEVGGALFDALFAGEVRSLLDRSRDEAARAGGPLRIQLRFESQELASLPWELLYDGRRGEYLCLSRQTPIIRYVEMAEPAQPLTVHPPLRLLAMVASPVELVALDVADERRRIDDALAPLVAAGKIELRWIEGQTWRDLQLALLDGPWHVFHFLGHGGFDAERGEGALALCGENGGVHELTATDLGVLLGDHESLRLAVLNACEGARTDQGDLFSSTATVLVRRGTPAVVAMQHVITDTAAIELSRTFYAALAGGHPVDASLGEARKAVAIGQSGSIEWATPVLYMRAPDGHVFDLPRQEPPAATATAPAPASASEPATTGYLLVDIKAYRCALGYAGVSPPGTKREGDGTVPAGRFHLRQVLYRADRRDPPVTKLPVRALEPELAWCDDPSCPEYNRLVTLPHEGSFEELWRDDHVYDLLAVIGYNDDPVVPGAGSAIFLHIARPGFTPTVGCVGVAVEDLLEILETFDADDHVTINA